MVLDVLLMLALDWADALPRPEFNEWGFASVGVSITALFAVAYLFARLHRNKALISRFIVCVYSIAPWFTLAGFAVKKSYVALGQVPWAVGVLWWAYLVWFFAAIGWILARLAGTRGWRVGVALAGYIAVSLSASSLHGEFFSVTFFG